MNYQPLFDYMSKQHGVDLIETDMIEIVRIVNEIQKPDEPQPKTIREWFEELPEPYRSEAIDNCKRCDNEEVSLPDALQAGFNWSTSKQGHSYWSKLNLKLITENK